MDAIVDFLSMGGYAAYVWPALGLTALVLVGLLLVTLRSLRRREAQLRAFEREAGGRAGSGDRTPHSEDAHEA